MKRERSPSPPPHEPTKHSNSEQPLDLDDWCNDFESVMSWMSQYNLEQLLEENNGICKISNFLPDDIARQAYELVKSIPLDEWAMTEAQRDYGKNNIDHKFYSLKGDERIEDFLRLFICLQDFERFSSFSAGCYLEGHFIESHDDRAYVDVLEESGDILTCSRDIACIYYMTDDWKEEDGGWLVDNETGDVYVPEFNSLVCFVVPRYHEVTKVSPGKKRYSVFGWFLEPGLLYDLYTGDDKKENDQKGDQEE
eukprot:TRINITY_DN1635_c0_g1_i1.p1 TRINITY_DN1635_c0_g1~~TRINITY_DN1635_c0_g1_i1.p1  ORF type:complete len:252 (+),score=58.02 TRINITY_DN1635_c0_g1_i1:309-1064(+)